jgi:hypothetical protein
VAGRLPPDEAARLLAEAFGKETETNARLRLAEGLSMVAGRLPSDEATRLLAEGLAKKTDTYARQELAKGLSAVSLRLLPDEAARLLADAVARETDAFVCKVIAEGLVIVTERVERAEADRICERALFLVQQREVSETNGQARMVFQAAADVLAQQLAEEKARRLVLQRASQRATAPDVLDRLLSDCAPPQRRRGAVATATAVGLASGGPLSALAAMPSAAEPLPCRLTTPELVELLKYPTCFGPARQVVLEHLGNRYGRTFANHWEFVRFAKEHDLGLDFTSPPKRPKDNAPVGRR